MKVITILPSDRANFRTSKVIKDKDSIASCQRVYTSRKQQSFVYMHLTTKHQSTRNKTARRLMNPLLQLETLTLLFSEIAFQVVLRAQNLLDNVEDTRDMGLIPGLGGSPGEGNGNYSSILT